MSAAETLAPPSARDLFARMRGKHVLVVGDVMLDEWIWGAVSRISPEAPVPIVAVREHSFTLGGSGNVAHNLRALGADVTLVATIGDDAEGRRVRELCTRSGIDVGALVTVRDRPTTRKTRIVAHNQQVVRADWESVAPLTDADALLVREQIAQRATASAAVVLSDYDKGLMRRAIVEAALAAPVVVADPKPRNVDLFADVTCVAPNLAEAAQASGIAITDDASLERAGSALLARLGCRLVIVTRGEAGMTLFGADGERRTVPSVARTVFDVSGAGDTVVAVLTLALACGASPQASMLLANFAAGAVVEKLGTATTSPDEVIALLEDARERA